MVKVTVRNALRAAPHPAPPQQAVATLWGNAPVRQAYHQASAPHAESEHQAGAEPFSRLLRTPPHDPRGHETPAAFDLLNPCRPALRSPHPIDATGNHRVKLRVHPSPSLALDKIQIFFTRLQAVGMRCRTIHHSREALLTQMLNQSRNRHFHQFKTRPWMKN